MIDPATIPLQTIGVILVFGLVLSMLCKRFGQNPVLGFILAGFVLGPAGLGFLGAEDVLVKGFSELGLFVLLFYLGIELSFRDFVKSGTSTLGLALADMIACALVGFAIASLAGFSFLFSAAVGLMMFSTSSAIVGKFILDRGLIREKPVQMALAVLILQDFLGILVLVFISSFASSGSAIELGLTAIVFAGASFFVVHELSKAIEQRFAKELGTTELTLYALSVGLLVATAGSFLGLSPALGAYFAGFALSELSVGQKVKSQINFSRDFFLLFFFVAFGASLFYNTEITAAQIPTLSEFIGLVTLAGILGIASIIVHAVILTIFGPVFGITNRESSQMAILLSPLGEFVIIITISILPLLAASEALVLAPIAFLIILITLLLFQPLYSRLELHDKITAMIPALAPRIQKPHIQEHTPESINWLKSLAKNILLVICLAWITMQLYKAVPTLGIQVPYGRLAVAVILFAVFAYVPSTKALRALRKLLHYSRVLPNSGRQ